MCFPWRGVNVRKVSESESAPALKRCPLERCLNVSVFERCSKFVLERYLNVSASERSPAQKDIFLNVQRCLARRGVYLLALEFFLAVEKCLAYFGN